MPIITEPTEAEIAALNATLKPCPFCGRPCKVEWTPVPDFRRDAPKDAITAISYHVTCEAVGTRCPMGQHWLCSTADAAVAAWNRRAI